MRNQKFIFIWLIFFSLSACHPTTPEKHSTALPINTPNQPSNYVATLPSTQLFQATSPTPTPLTPQKDEETDALLQPTPTLEATVTKLIVPEIVLRCPINREVSVEGLNIANSHNVLITQPIKEIDGGFWTFWGDFDSPELIPNTVMNEEDWIRLKDISPNGQWLIFYTGYSQEETYTTSLWISSTDGSQQWIVTNIDYQTQAYWISNELILVASAIPLSGVIESNENLIYLLINPFTGESQNIFALPTDSRPLILKFDNTLRGEYELILDGDLKLFNYFDGTSNPIFPWIPGHNVDNPWFLYFGLSIKFDINGMFDIAIKQPYGLDVVLDMSYETATNIMTEYDFVMTKLALPGENLDTSFLKWLPHQNILMIERYEYPNTTGSGTHQLYLLDVANYVLYDYCLEFNNVSTFALSPDGEYLAWSFTDEEFRLAGSIILEMKTGYMMQLNDWQIVGWGTK